MLYYTENTFFYSINVKVFHRNAAGAWKIKSEHVKSIVNFVSTYRDTVPAFVEVRLAQVFYTAITYTLILRHLRFEKRTINVWYMCLMYYFSKICSCLSKITLSNDRKCLVKVTFPLSFHFLNDFFPNLSIP